MDLEKMPVSKSGNNYLLTVMDYFTEWPHAVLIPNKSAKTVATALYNIFLVMGFPAIYSSDQGREFVNDVISCLTEKTKAAHIISSANHPLTNGLVERFNKTIQSMILKTCSEQQDDWDENIEVLLFSYRTMVHSTTKKTPFEICLVGFQCQK